ncbi:MAG: hypothetical protein IJE08_03575 [Clostridia bacterium]|nr:hypothetical protein [Clostridia bacterium]
MKKKLTAALCAALCLLLGTGAGYLIGQAEHQSRFDRMYDQAAFSPGSSPLIADAQAAAALAETYYRENVDPDGSDPRLVSSIFYLSQSGIWSVCQMPEYYVLKQREGSLDYMMVGGSYDMEILAADGTILSAQYGE